MTWLDLHEGILGEFAERQGCATPLEALSGVDDGRFDLRVVRREESSDVVARVARWKKANAPSAASKAAARAERHEQATERRREAAKAHAAAWRARNAEAVAEAEARKREAIKADPEKLARRREVARLSAQRKRAAKAA